ncbi:MAG: radical SAM protein [Peptococcaceae bacterium]|nr:radical SAM protein [Peptococcaceae bacterium]
MCYFSQQVMENVPRVICLNCSSLSVRVCRQIVRMFLPHVCFAEGADGDALLSLKVRFEESEWGEKMPVELQAAWECGGEIVSHVMDREEIVRLWHLGSGAGVKSGSRLDSDSDSDLRMSPTWSKEPMVQIAAKQVVLRLLEKMTGQRMPWGVLTGVRPGRLWQKLTDIGLSYEERREVLMSYYLVDEVKVELLQAIAEEQKPCLEWRGKGGHKLAVYVSIPFCPSRCRYCTFPGYVAESVDRAGEIDTYLETLFKEISFLSQDIYTYGLRVNTVYMGGGTPTVLETEQLQRVIERLRGSLPWQDAVEFCCEAGRPDTITPEKLAVLAAGGVTRLCINPQTLEDGTLQRVGRNHSAEDFVRAYELARREVSWHINADMILGLPGEGETHAGKTAERLVEMGLDSITVHYLTLKRGSDLWLRSYEDFVGRRAEGVEGFDVNLAGRSAGSDAGSDVGCAVKRSDKGVSAAQSLARMGERVRQRFLGAGYHPYYVYRQKGMVGNLENVGYCRPGAQCLYNSVMIAENQHVAGLGAGASSKIVTGDGHKNLYHPKDITNYGKRFYETVAKRRELWGRN